ncbi:MAG: alpha/beta fold hydrolase [Pseudomonadota bacterium]
MPRDGDEAALRERDILLRHPARHAPPPPSRVAAAGERIAMDYVEIGDASLLIRWTGELTGATPPVLVLPPVPGASALCEDLLRSLGATRPALALDLPGHGESDPLPGNPQTVAVWVDATRRALDALGIRQVHLYGYQGGAAAAVELARVAPARVATVMLDAPIALDATARAAFVADYAPDITPSWEGAHLLRAWHHLRDQELWWPWFDRRRAAIRTAPPRIDPADLTLRVRESLKQPASYAPAWRAALAYPLVERLGDVRTPVALICAASDIFAPLFGGMRAARATVLDIDDSAASRAAALNDWLRSHARA